MVNSIILSGMAWASSLKSAIASRIGDEHGQDLLEYAILGGAIAMVAAVALYATGDWMNLNTFKSKIGDCLSFSNTCAP